MQAHLYTRCDAYDTILIFILPVVSSKPRAPPWLRSLDARLATQELDRVQPAPWACNINKKSWDIRRRTYGASSRSNTATQQNLQYPPQSSGRWGSACICSIYPISSLCILVDAREFRGNTAKATQQQQHVRTRSTS